tara:strand:- start:351 stop:740 length:390 start_codon:yes stop_codon:yes gene_type:complete
MASFLKISGLLLLVNVHGENPRRYLKNKLLGQKVNRHREYKQLVAGATHLSLDDLEMMATKPGVLFNRDFNHDQDSLTMSLDDLERISVKGLAFVANEENIKGDESNWNDIMTFPPKIKGRVKHFKTDK